MEVAGSTDKDGGGFKYFGSTVQSNGECRKELKSRSD